MKLNLIIKLCIIHFIIILPISITSLPVKSYDLKNLKISTFKIDDKFKGAQASGIMDATQQEIWDVLTDHNNASEFMPNIIKSKVLKRNGNKLWIELEVGFPFLKESYISEITEEKIHYRLSWKQHEGPFIAFNGKYILHPSVNGKTEMIYFIEIDHKLLSDWIREYLIKNSIPNMYNAVHNRIVSKRSKRTPLH